MQNVMDVFKNRESILSKIVLFGLRKKKLDKTFD